MCSFSVYKVKEMQARSFKNAAGMLAMSVVCMETTAGKSIIAYSMQTALRDHFGIVWKELLKQQKRRECVSSSREYLCSGAPYKIVVSTFVCKYLLRLWSLSLVSCNDCRKVLKRVSNSYDIFRVICCNRSHVLGLIFLSQSFDVVACAKLVPRTSSH